MEPDRFAATPPDAAPSPAPPFALIHKVKGALRLAAVDARAQGLGLMPGLSLADARARHPELQAFDSDPAADRHWLDRLAQKALDFSPLVSIAPPDGLTIDITGVAHLFGGEAALRRAAEARFADIGLSLRLALAGTADAGQALARFARQLPPEDEAAAIRALPVLALTLNDGLDEAGLLALRRAGLKTIGDLVSRPAASLAARFGGDAVMALRRLTGEAEAPILPVAHPDPLHVVRRFAEPVAHQDRVAQVMLDLMQEAVAMLEARGLGGRRFVLRLHRSDGAVHRLAIATGQPTRDPALVLRLFDERIGALADPLDPGFGYDSMDLHVAAAQPLAARQPGLGDDDPGQNAPELAELIDRLSTRLGPGRVRCLLPQDSHVPEQAQLALPVIHAPPPALQPRRWPAPASDEPPLRPLFLFDPPQPVEVLAQVPDGPPHRFRWRRKLHEVRLYEGPERIATEWWRRKGGEHDGRGGLTRDYYRVEDVRGRRFWIFRHGLYAEKPDPRWYLHGLFA